MFLVDYILEAFSDMYSLLFVAIVVIVIVVASNSSKKKQISNQQQIQQQTQQEQQESQQAQPKQQMNQSQSGQVQPQPASAQPTIQPTRQPSDHSSAYNILLYVGSFFIVSSMFLLVSSDYDLLAAMLFVVTISCFGAGLLLHYFVRRLRPVGAAFTITSLLLFPLWFVAFMQLGMRSISAALFATNIIWIIATMIATSVTKNRAAGWLSYLSIFVLGNTTMSLTKDGKAQIYAAIIWPGIFSYVPVLLWSLKTKWLPIGFRAATEIIATILAPGILWGSIAILAFAPGCAAAFPFLRTIAAFLALGQLAIGYGFERSEGKLVAIRFAIQGLILCLLIDALNFPSLARKQDQGICLILAITWLVSFFAQAIISLLVQAKKHKSHAESAALLVSLISIFASFVFFRFYFDATICTVINIISELMLAILGAAIVVNRKNMHWGLATSLPILLIPLELLMNLSIDYASAGWLCFAYYSFISLAFVGVYQLIKNIQKRKGYELALISLALSCASALVASIFAGWIEAGWVLFSVVTFLFALASGRHFMREIAIYFATAAAYSYCGSIYGLLCPHATFLDNYGSNEYSVLMLIRSIVLAIPIFTLGIVKERKQKNTPRLVVGYLFSLISVYVLATRKSYGLGDIFAVICIFEQAIFLTAGALLRKTWLMIASGVAAAICTLVLTDGLNFIWLLLIGVALIAVVIWKLLSSDNKKDNSPDAQQ